MDPQVCEKVQTARQLCTQVIAEICSNGTGEEPQEQLISVLRELLEMQGQAIAFWRKYSEFRYGNTLGRKPKSAALFTSHVDLRSRGKSAIHTLQGLDRTEQLSVLRNLQSASTVFLLEVQKAR